MTECFISFSQNNLAVPQTPLYTQGILREENENWTEMQVWWSLFLYCVHTVNNALQYGHWWNRLLFFTLEAGLFWLFSPYSQNTGHLTPGTFVAFYCLLRQASSIVDVISSQDEMDRALAERRINDDQVHLKTVEISSNPLLERRRKRN